MRKYLTHTMLSYYLNPNHLYGNIAGLLLWDLWLKRTPVGAAATIARARLASDPVLSGRFRMWKGL